MSMQPLTSNRLAFDDASDVVEHYLSQGWADGLPIVPPTVEKVRQFLEYAGRAPSEIVATEPTKGRVITAEKVAINAVMAGCLPEYFPVVLAAVEATSEPQFNLHGMSVSTMGAAVLTVVNGPIARQLGLNSGVNVFGPGHRPNATIGRAIRLVVRNASGAVPGVLDQATLGHAGRYAWCIAEAEDVSPWEPLHVERGFAAHQSTVTVFAGLSPIQVANHVANDPEGILGSFRDALFAVGPRQGELILVLAPELIEYIKAAGWSKQQVKAFLFQVAQRKASDWAEAGVALSGKDLQDPNAKVGVVQSPDNIVLLVAGGLAGAFAAIVPLWAGGVSSRSVTKVVQAPS